MPEAPCRKCGTVSSFTDLRRFWFCEQCETFNDPMQPSPKPDSLQEWDALRRWVGAKEAADILGTSQGTVYQLNKKGLIPKPVANDPLTWRRSDLEGWKRERATA